MKGGRVPLGYTIIEVMIVLAVSGVMFLIAATFVNGKQATTSFNQGVNELSSRVQGLANQVENGQFSDINLPPCQVLGGGLQFDTNPAASKTAQGTHSDCVFLGKLFYFYKDTDTYPQNYAVYSLADATTNPTTQNPITSVSSASDAPFVTLVNPLTINTQTPQSLEVYNMKVYPTGGGSPVNYSLGFIQGLGQASGLTDDNSSTYKSGTSTLSLVYSTGLDHNDSPDPNNADTGVNGRLNTATKAVICLSDGNRNATITIDTASNGLNVNVRHLPNGDGVSACAGI
jgi:prepilin-type N-terminal cleavage/methylation domain-containing protein